ncbi:MAG: FAD-dependent oxidoreductase [Planctomycetota bacterium]
MTKERIAVIGAGLAGVTCAGLLHDAGRHVVVFDKGRGLAGRMSSRRAHGAFLDHGAQYFTARDPAFAEAVLQWEEEGFVERWPSSLQVEEARFRGAPHMSSLCESLAHGLAVRSETRIDQLLCGPQGWELRDGAGDWLGPFDTVIVAVPAPQAAPLLQPAPALADAVGRVEMDPCWAGLFLFEERLGLDWDGRFLDEHGMAWVARHDQPRGESWVLHADVAWTEEHLGLSKPDALPHLREALAAVVGRELPEAKYERAHLWRYARTRTPLGEPYLWNGMTRIGACGDWCLGGRIEAAWTSGHTLAHHLLTS